MRVIVAEDSEGMRAVVRTMLERLGATEILEAANGAAAWELIQAHDVDLVLTDWDMPEMTGPELIQQLRRTPGKDKIPVLVFTSHTEREAVMHAVRAGADGFLAKPFSPPKLQAKVRQALSKRPASRVDRVLSGVDRLARGDTHPLVIVGHPAARAERLSQPENEDGLDFLSSVATAVANVNRYTPDVHVGYLLEDSGSGVSSRVRGLRSRAKLLVLDTLLGRSALSLARVLSINDDSQISVLLVCESFSEFTQQARYALERLSVKLIERHALDTEAMEAILVEEVIARTREDEEDESDSTPSPEQVAARLEGDMRTRVDLPVLSQVCQQILELDSQERPLQEWVDAIDTDPLVRAQVIRRARSPFFGFQGEISETSRALVLLGTKQVKAIVVAGATRRSFSRIQEEGFSVEEYWLHSVATGVVADMLVFPYAGQAGWTPDQRQQFTSYDLLPEAVATLSAAGLWKRFDLPPQQDPFVAGLLHDIGRVALAVSYPGLLPMALEETRSAAWSQPLRVAEASLTGTEGHTVAGAILADSWKLGPWVRRVIGEHHSESSGNPLAHLVAIADTVAGGIYPVPADAEYPTVGLFAPQGPPVDADLEKRLSAFLPGRILSRYGLQVEALVDVGRACEPSVRHLVEDLRRSA